MIEGLQKIFATPELRKRIGFTLLMLIVCRIGCFIPVPGVDGDLAIKQISSQLQGQNLFQMMDMFAGGAFSQMTVAALGVVPYISASIIMQMMTIIIPSIQRLQKEGESGRKKITQWTRYFTVFIALIHSFFYARWVHHSMPDVVLGVFREHTALFYALVAITMTTGTLFLMWIGEQITEKGVGNGTSMIISLGILASFPSTVGLIWQQLNLGSQQAGQLGFAQVIMLFGTFVCVVMGIIMVSTAVHRIPLQYARRDAGGGGATTQTTFLPLKVNYAGVIPVIFASSFLMLPGTIGQFLGGDTWYANALRALTPGTTAYTCAFVLLIVGFTYVWVATTFNTAQISSDLKSQGGFVPGLRPGKPTQDYIDTIMSRVTFIGAICLALIAISPTILGNILHVPHAISYFFGGTSVLIMVGVIMDTATQIQSYLLTSNYQGFMNRSRLRI